MIELMPETEALARRLAEAEHRSVDQTVRQALEYRASLIKPRQSPEKASPEVIAARRKAIDDFAAKIAAAPILDPRSPKEIMDDLDSL